MLRSVPVLDAGAGAEPKDAAATIPFHAKEQAAEWFALLRSGEATEADRARWSTWLAASDDHRRAWSFVERISQRFAPILSSHDPRATTGVLQTTNVRLARRQLLLGLLACGGAGLLGWGTLHHATLSAMAVARLADHRTSVGETREIGLADGTRVWLGPASAFDEDYRVDLRRLRLLAGELFIRTAADAARPFVVDTEHGRMRALGTRFNVRIDSGHTELAVFEGAVEIHTGGDILVVVSAGQQTRFDRQSIATVTPADPAREAWTHGILLAQDMPLGQVVAELARYRHGHLGVAPEVATLGVYGSFPLDDTDRALAMLASILPLRVRQPLPWWRTVVRRDQP